MRSATLSGPSRRLRLLAVLLLSSFLVLAARAAHLTLLDSRGKGRGQRQITKVLQLPAPRGLIVDRRGVELAVTIPAPSIYVVPHALGDRRQTAQKLAHALGMDPATLAADLERRTRFAFVKRWTTREEAETIRKLDLPGVGILKEPRRAYPAGALAGQLIGFANIDEEGVRGIEQQEDRALRGRARTVTVERDARGRHLVVDPSLPRDTAGADVRLTLDAKLQAAAEGALASLVERTGAKGGSVVTLDPRTGDILSLAEHPPTDPNDFRSLDFKSTRSRAFHDAVEPGSTFKVFLVAGALDAGVIQSDEMIETSPGWLRIPGKTIRDHEDYGRISIAQILEISSNVGAVTITQRLEPRRHYELLRRFGFGHSTESGFPQESAGILRHYRGWQPVDRATLAFGQGVSVTPVQLASATAALANGGVWQKPRLVAARRKAGGTWEEVPREAGHRVVSARAAAETLRMMETVVSATGTGRRASLRGLRVAGKTGTAQKFDTEAGRYSKTDYLAWFIGVVPANDPRLAITVMIDEPQGRAHGGGDAAAPLFAQVASAQLAHLGIVTAPQSIRSRPFRTLAAKAEEEKARRRAAALPEKKPVQVAKAGRSDRKAIAPASRPAKAARRVVAVPRVQAPSPKSVAKVTHLVPDFRGETLTSAQGIAAKASIVLELHGNARGLVVEQRPHPGTVVTGDSPRVRLRFTLDSPHREEG
ncbi:MAG: penicillin-binding transpeptidase domain-containing protein [Myxococcota bacterium]